ncbi:copper resistance protein CopC [Leifsonia sp. AG29]|uniref:copper resistance protein CopC n=1 Tax=Leifsonia sp. AG29 TaxID=2598860 RepID=UPI00131DD6D7|nr:copper resistance protein CopC [Leifsonia sp. AG29]
MRLRAALTAAAAALGALTLALVPLSAASAHDYLVGSTPAAGSTVTQPLDRVALSFNDRVLDLSGNGSGTLVTVTGPGQSAKHFETGCATVADTDVTAPVALGGAGDYTITYQVVSADGHTVSSTIPFHYEPPAGTPAASGSDAAPCGARSPATGASPGGAATPAPSAATTSGAGESASTAQPIRAPASNDLGIVIGIAVAIVLLALVGVVIVIVTARRKPAASAAGPVRDRPDEEKGLGGPGGTA